MPGLWSESLEDSIDIEDPLRILLINISGISSFATSLSNFSSSKFDDLDQNADAGVRGLNVQFL